VFGMHKRRAALHKSGQAGQNKFFASIDRLQASQ